MFNISGAEKSAPLILRKDLLMKFVFFVFIW